MANTTDAARYIPYSDNVEKISDDEEQTNAAILNAFAHVQEKTSTKNNHGIRTVHAKSHGILKGELIVYPNLPAAFAQGVFASPKTYGLMWRFSASPADIMSDKVGGVRGLAIKLIGVPGAKLLPGLTEAQTQDFTFVNHPTFPAKDGKAFLIQAKMLDNVISNLPEPVQEAQGIAMRAVGAAGRAFGMDPIGTAVGLAKPETNILGDTFYTGVAIRYGAFMAKISVAPLSSNLIPFIDASIDTSKENVLRDSVVEFFSSNSAEYEVRAQLCTSLDRMPVEDPSVEWPEDESPYIPVAKIILPAQNAYGDARSKYGEDVLAFNPWHSIVEHKPLGSIMRVRKVVYQASSNYRHQRNGVEQKEPTSIDEMPD